MYNLFFIIRTSGFLSLIHIFPVSNPAACTGAESAKNHPAHRQKSRIKLKNRLFLMELFLQIWYDHSNTKKFSAFETTFNGMPYKNICANTPAIAFWDLHTGKGVVFLDSCNRRSARRYPPVRRTGCPPVEKRRQPD